MQGGGLGHSGCAAALDAGRVGRGRRILGSGQFLTWAMEHLEIADAVLRLESHTDDDYGPVPRPDPALAAELEEHMTHTH
ncbi:hypothetical protein [Streptomyces sp. NPDC051567]|uniref:hypothetical protein n=1 Tax=Streptomyces sp. NPDC051567 TaxID=3365660 RepID=UPI0037BDC9A4